MVALPPRQEKQARIAAGLPRVRVGGALPRLKVRPCSVAAVAVVIFSVAWAIVIWRAPGVRFVLLDPRTTSGFEVFRAVVSLFVALVILLFPEEQLRARLRWVALGFLFLGVGSLGLGYLYPVIEGPLSANSGMYASLAIRTLTTAAFAIALALPWVPRLSNFLMAGLLATGTVVSMLVVLAADWLPALTTIDSLADLAVLAVGPLPGLTWTHWLLSTVPLVLAAAAAIGGYRICDRPSLVRWLVLGMVFFAGAQLHAMLWPTAFSAAVTSSSALRIGFTITVVAGVVLELRRIADERTQLLQMQQEHSSRLEDLTRLRSDFMKMVAHELASPLAGIRRSAELFGDRQLNDAELRAMTTIRTESEALVRLVDDIRASAEAERDDFAVSMRMVDVQSIVDCAAHYARSLGTDHAFAVVAGTTGMVWTDPERIGQVMRNLLDNAVKYSNPASAIEIRVSEVDGGKIRMEVENRGPGISPEEMTRIFEKFGRGCVPGDEQGRTPGGVGLGLYLSRRIVRACCSELMVTSVPGETTSFWFDLPVRP